MCSFSEADAGSHWGPHGLRDGETFFPEDLTETKSIISWGLASQEPQPRALPLQSGSPYCVASLQGALVGVVGKVGCGKSSLLAAITGELHR